MRIAFRLANAQATSAAGSAAANRSPYRIFAAPGLKLANAPPRESPNRWNRGLPKTKLRGFATYARPH